MVDYILVGQGIAGTVLHRKLTIHGYDVHVIDEGHKRASSSVAAGLVNPITGRKYVKSWRVEEFIPEARNTYDELAEFLNMKTYNEPIIHRALYSIKDENIWHGRKEDPLANQFILSKPDTSAYNDVINGVLSYGSLTGGMQVELKSIISKYRTYLTKEELISAETYDEKKLKISNEGICYGTIHAKGIIFAEGYRARDNHLWRGLTFSPVKGEVLIVRIEGDPFEDVLRHKLFICPIGNGLYWIGSDYEWDFKDDQPTKKGGEKLKSRLEEILNLPFEIIDHIAGIRPAVKDRKPFLGVHPEYRNVFIFNGMGTKGSSLAPFWAEHFVGYLKGFYELDKDVDIANKWNSH